MLTKSMLILTSVIRLGQSKLVSSRIDEDSLLRLMTCIRVLANPKEEYRLAFLESPRNAYNNLVTTQSAKTVAQATAKGDIHKPIKFRLLENKTTLENNKYDYSFAQDTESNEYQSKLSQIVQLTGFSDPVYAEAYVTVNQFDIFMDIVVVNQTADTLQNLTIEFSTLGDLKLVDRPKPKTIGPSSFHTIKANIKVSSTESGVIFSQIVWDPNYSVTMQEISMDILNYIKPQEISDIQFRQLWQDLEWENKVNVDTNLT
jgi:coatomer subunit beta